MINPKSPNTNRVLIADDDPVLLEIVKALVEQEGYEAVTADNGRDAYRILHRDANFRAVILDMLMPHLEGSDLLHQMQTEKRLSRIPVITMSSSPDLMTLTKGIGTGAVAFVPKPFTPDQMRKVLRIVMLSGNESSEEARPSIDDFKAPDFKTPDFQTPDFKTPDFKTPDRPIAKSVLNVLLVEDNPGEAIVIECVLLKAVATIPQISRVAISRADLLSVGIERMLDGDIDIVFLDLSLPDSEGLETLERILEQDPGVPVVVLTGREDVECANLAMKLGAQDYLVKGKVDETGMIRAVRYAFEVRQESPSYASQ